MTGRSVFLGVPLDFFMENTGRSSFQAAASSRPGYLVLFTWGLYRHLVPFGGYVDGPSWHAALIATGGLTS